MVLSVKWPVVTALMKPVMQLPETVRKDASQVSMDQDAMDHVEKIVYPASLQPSVQSAFHSDMAFRHVISPVVPHATLLPLEEYVRNPLALAPTAV